MRDSALQIMLPHRLSPTQADACHVTRAFTAEFLSRSCKYPQSRQVNRPLKAFSDISKVVKKVAFSKEVDEPICTLKKQDRNITQAPRTRPILNGARGRQSHKKANDLPLSLYHKHSVCASNYGTHAPSGRIKSTTPFTKATV